jgi:hypothetical protein
MGKFHEGTFVSPKNLLQMQDRSTARSRASDLRESEAQATAGMMISNLKVENHRVFEAQLLSSGIQVSSFVL